jgi:hypothetical protein
MLVRNELDFPNALAVKSEGRSETTIFVAQMRSILIFPLARVACVKKQKMIMQIAMLECQNLSFYRSYKKYSFLTKLYE